MAAVVVEPLRVFVVDLVVFFGDDEGVVVAGFVFILVVLPEEDKEEGCCCGPVAFCSEPSVAALVLASFLLCLSGSEAASAAFLFLVSGGVLEDREADWDYNP